MKTSLRGCQLTKRVLGGRVGSPQQAVLLLGEHV